jgi:hypothetical protein
VVSSEPAAGAEQGSPWQALGGLVLWLLRLALDLPGTVIGFRRWVLLAAPVVPGLRATPQPALLAGLADADEDHDSERTVTGSATQQPTVSGGELSGNDVPRSELAPGEKKRDALIRLYERCGETGDPRYGDRTKAAQMAGEIAGRIGYHAGTARRELAKHLAGRASAVHALEETGPDAQEVA